MTDQNEQDVVINPEASPPVAPTPAYNLLQGHDPRNEARIMNQQAPSPPGGQQVTTG